MSVASRAMTPRANAFGALIPVPTAVPPSGQLADARQHVAQPLDAVLDLAVA